MAEGYKSYRIRTEVGQDAPNVINVHLDQTYDEFEILSLKIDQKNSYNLYQSDKGIVVGRVLANGGVGVSNAKVSIFIESDGTTDMDERILYPYSTVFDTNSDRVRYNLLPDYVDETCHQNVGTFPNKRYVLDNKDIIEVFEKYWKYTTVTNASGDYMIYGVPTGSHTLHMDVDLSDIGFLSQKPRDLMYKGYNINQFESPTKFKEDTNLNSLSQIKSQDIGIYVYPFWGDSTDNPENIAVTRCDIQVDYKFEPTCVFMGCMITDTGSNAIGKNCAGTSDVGKMSDLVAGEGKIEMIRKTIDNKVEEFQVKGNRLIDGDGVWCYQIPMNLDYVMTDEFGNLVPTDNPDKGIPTRTRVRFRISLDDVISDNSARKRCNYLVPNNPRLDKERYPEFFADETHEPDYEFGTNTRDESYCDLFWNKVYSVKNYIPRIQKNSKITNRKHTGIKLINHYGKNNPMPYNSLSIKLSFSHRFICVLTKIFIKLVGFLNNIISLIGMLPCKLAQFFRAIGNFFNFSIFGWRPLAPVARLFFALADFFDLIAPPCIAISSEFCSEDVTHAYTFYPGCGEFFGITFSLIRCVWDKTKKQHTKHQINGEVDPEDRTQATNDPAELYNCVESQLAEDNDATSFNFQNDWINGTLYSPLWFRKITPKKSFLFGLIKRKAKDEWCSADHVYHSLVRIFQPCAVYRDGSKSYVGHDGENKTAYFMSSSANSQCGNDGDCHKAKTVVGLDYGLIRTRKTMLGETVYYYKPIEYDKDLNEVKLLFATDIILLGSLNDCDLNGVPQFFKSLESTTYKLPQNMLFTDNFVVPKINKDGTINFNNFDQTSITEATGNDWGNNNDDMCGEPDGGLFYSIGCSSVDMIPKSCINLSRICEFGVSLDESKQIPNLSEVETMGDNAFDTLIPDGFISKDELYNDNERSMFATMNGNELRTRINLENGLKEYDFRHLYLDNFDNSLYEIMASRQRRCTDYTYKYNYSLEDFSPGYYDFRMGKKPYYYDRAHHTLPRYENSLYFYFGLTDGKTALDKFNSQFFAECHNPEEAVSPIGIDLKGNSWCAELNDNYDGYLKIDLSNISLPCDILIQADDSDYEFYLEDVEDNKIILINSNRPEDIPEGYVRKCMEDGNNTEICCLQKNGYYTMTVTDADGEIITLDLDYSVPLLHFDFKATNFKLGENTLLEKYNTYDNIAKDREKAGWSSIDSTDPDYSETRLIGGTIAINNIIDGLTGNKINNYIIKVESLNSIEGYFNQYTNQESKFTFTIKKSDAGSDCSCLYWVNCNSSNINSTNPYIFGVPKGDERYRVTITELCKINNEWIETNNTLVRTVMVKNATPYKLYINGIIDYDVIKHWTTGYTLSNNANSNKTKIGVSDFNKNNFSYNWLNISKKDSIVNGVWRYNWQELLSYQKALENINNEIDIINEIIPLGLYDDNNFPISKLSGNLTDVELVGEVNEETDDVDGIVQKIQKWYDARKAEEDVFYNEIRQHIGETVTDGSPDKKYDLNDDGIINEEDLHSKRVYIVEGVEIPYSVEDIKIDIDNIVQECYNIVEIKQDFVNEMRTAFWMSCPTDDKTITFTTSTDDMPVAYFIAHRAEKMDNINKSYNVILYNEKNKLTYSFNEGDMIERIKIPTLAWQENERYGTKNMNQSDKNKYNIPDSTVCIGIDNYSNFKKEKSLKYALFVGVINSEIKTKKGVPNGSTIPMEIKENSGSEIDLSRLFGFHIIDKLFTVNYIAWMPISEIPYFKPRINNGKTGIDTNKAGKYINLSGFFAGTIYNGITDESGNLKKTQINETKFDIVRGETDEDSVPVHRYIVGWVKPEVDEDYIDEDYVDYDNDPEYNPFTHYVVTNNSLNEKQYVPLLPVPSNLEIEDYGNCVITEEFTTTNVITLEPDSINAQDDNDNYLHVSCGIGDNVIYFGFEAKPSYNHNGYGPNYVDPVEQKINEGINPGSHNEWYKNPYEIFSEDVDYFKLLQWTVNDDDLMETKRYNSDGQSVTVEKLLNLTDDDWDDCAVSTNGEFKDVEAKHKGGGAYFIVAVAENGCRAISPVYCFYEFKKIRGAVITKKIFKINNGEKVTSYQIGFGVDRKKWNEYGDPGYQGTWDDYFYYLMYYPYNLEVETKIKDGDNLYELSHDGDMPPYNTISGNDNSYLFVDVDSLVYSLIKSAIDKKASDFFDEDTQLYLTDCTGLVHNFELFDNCIYGEITEFNVVFNLNGSGTFLDGTTKDKEINDLVEGATYVLLYVNPSPDKVFKGWNTDKFGTTGEEAGTEIVCKDALIWYAIWEDAPVDIVFNLNGYGTFKDGTTRDKVLTLKNGDEYDLPYVDPDDSKVFKGWNTDMSATTGESPETTMICDGQLTWYAIWEDAHE